jgi:hypothetical protein
MVREGEDANLFDTPLHPHSSSSFKLDAMVPTGLVPGGFLPLRNRPKGED